jgi:hypothetical protein
MPSTPTIASVAPVLIPYPAQLLYKFTFLFLLVFILSLKHRGLIDEIRIRAGKNKLNMYLHSIRRAPEIEALLSETPQRWARK